MTAIFMLLAASIVRVCYLAGEFARMLIKKLREEEKVAIEERLQHEEKDRINILCIEIAGLCHDLGKSF